MSPLPKKDGIHRRARKDTRENYLCAGMEYNVQILCRFDQKLSSASSAFSAVKLSANEHI